MSHIRYLKYVLRHKWFVFVECVRLGIPIRGLMHDLSKFRPREWFPYVRYFYGEYPTQQETHRALVIGVGFMKSEEDIAREFDVAWNHHQKRNDHHWQYWLVHYDDGGSNPLPMPDKCRREMLADWRGAGRALGKPDTKAWYIEQCDNMELHRDTRRWIEDQLNIDWAAIEWPSVIPSYNKNEDTQEIKTDEQAEPESTQSAAIPD